MIPIRDLDHVVLRVSAVDEVLAFYRDALGMKVERELDIGLIQLRAGRSLIDIVPVDSELGRRGGSAPDAEAKNMDHFCLRVDPFDAQSIRAHLAKHGIDAGTVERRYGADGYGPSMYINDPQGNTVELKGPPEACPPEV